jgi:type II secretory pathway component GspD/PulD (secretin)
MTGLRQTAFPSRRLLSVVLALVFVVTENDLSLFADPAAGTPSTTAPANTPAPVTGAGVRDPMIEVSVDSLEISETNENILGLLWGTQTQGGSRQLNFIERSVPSIFSAGQLDRDKLTATLDALITNNQARVLANPTLLTKSGFEASFLVGGEIPYPTIGQGGVGGVEFKKYGVVLKILPQITPRKTIEAQINVGVSNIDNANSITLQSVTVPALASREAGSKVEVLDGETVVLAGIKQSRREKTVQKVPFLGYIPIIGLLFTHKDEKTVQTSLVLFVTFRMVK